MCVYLVNEVVAVSLDMWINNGHHLLTIHEQDDTHKQYIYTAPIHSE